MTRFIGRKEELESLRRLRKKKSSSMVVIWGRRRIGKSRLIQEFAKESPSYLFSGSPPTPKTTKQEQINQFIEQFSALLNFPRFEASDWLTVFRFLAKQCEQGPILLAFDEISWMGSKDHQFLGALKTAWDLYFSKNPDLMLILCGSVSSWIEKNILNSTGFVGRFSLYLSLKELPLKEAIEFWDGRRESTTPYEILKVLAVTGGVPRYLEELQLHESAEENIRRLCFDRKGLLFQEFDHIFSDLFMKKAPLYTDILSTLVKGPATVDEVASRLKVSKGGWLLTQLRVLSQAGFVSEDAVWNVRTMKTSKAKRFRLSDNYTRFYLRYIRSQIENIEKGLYDHMPITSLPGWNSMMGLQFENLVVNNVFVLLRAMKIDPSDVRQMGPFFQKKTQRHEGCQVDLLIQTRFSTAFICEVKFMAGKIGMETVRGMEEKRRHLALPKNCARRLVLIHVNGVTDEVLESEALDHIIDFNELL